MMVRRAQERAHSLNTCFVLMDSSRPSAKHSSAFSGAPVKRNDSKYSLVMSSVKMCLKSAGVAYAPALTISFPFFLDLLMRHPVVPIAYQDLMTQPAQDFDAMSRQSTQKCTIR